MKRIARFVFAAWLTFAAAQSIAAPQARIEGVQMPAWFERPVVGAVEKVPLAPGMELKGGDTIRTGAGARVYVKLAEGSLVQLGENASLQLQEIAEERGGLFRAALNVLEGAFRFTTDVLRRDRRRDVRITARQVTAGIRGTDLWGRSTEERQIVCLIEGRIEVGAEGEQAVVMDQPRQFYRREKGQTQPIGFIEPAQLAQWARETAITDGAGAARRGGRWNVTLATADTQQDALALYDRARAAGYAAEIKPVRANEKFVYDVRIAQLPSKAEAESLARQLQARLGVAGQARLGVAGARVAN